MITAHLLLMKATNISPKTLSNKALRNAYTLLILLFITVCAAYARYEIRLYTPFPTQTFLLAGYYGDNIYLIDSLRTDEEGWGLFEGEKKLNQGVYLLVFPDSSDAEIIIMDDQQFEIRVLNDTSTNIAIIDAFESETFNQYADSVKRLYKHAHIYKINRIDTRSTLEKLKIQYIHSNEGTFLANYLRLGLTPKNDYSEVTLINEESDSVKWLKHILYFQNHYFDNVAFHDSRILYTPLFHKKTETFFDRLIPQNPETLVSKIDQLLGIEHMHEEVFVYLVHMLATKYYELRNIAVYEKVYVHLSNTYILSNDLFANTYKLEQIRTEIKAREPYILGAPFPVKTVTNLSGISEQIQLSSTANTLIYFWEVGCPLCLNSFPRLRKLVLDIPAEELYIVSLCVSGNLTEWKKTMKDINPIWKSGYLKEQKNLPPLPVSFMPYYILVSPTGEIINKSNKLEEVLN